MRAVMLDARGQPSFGEVPEPDGPWDQVRVLACGLCGSDVEKFGAAAPGTVLGHEVAAELEDGRRVALIHHFPCGTCERCRAGHESMCAEFEAPTIVPGGFAELALARAWVHVPDDVPTAVATYAEPLACVLRGAEYVPRGRVLVVGLGFIGRLFQAVLRERGDEVFGLDRDPRRAGEAPDGPVDAAVVCAPGAAASAAAAVSPGGTLLTFAPGGALDTEAIYRRELHVVGSRSATPRHMEAAIGLLPSLDVPEPTVLPFARFAEGLELYRRRDALKIVFTPT